jgi:Ca2+-binding RTX toxin-like protein
LAVLGGGSEAPKQDGQAKVTEKEEQEHTEATREEQGSSPKAASEDDRCGGTRSVDLLKKAGVDKVFDSPVQPGDPGARFTTNDLPGCPNGGLLEGTDESDKLAGEYGEDEVRGLGAADTLSGGGGGDVLYGGPGNDELQAGAGLMGADPFTDRSENALHGGPGNDFMAGAEGDDVIYGGDGDDEMLWGGGGENVLHGGDGNDYLDGISGQRDMAQDKLYCGEGKDRYLASNLDYVDSSCEVDHDRSGG